MFLGFDNLTQISIEFKSKSPAGLGLHPTCSIYTISSMTTYMTLLFKLFVHHAALSLSTCLLMSLFRPHTCLLCFCQSIQLSSLFLLISPAELSFSIGIMSCSINSVSHSTTTT